MTLIKIKPAVYSLFTLRHETGFQRHRIKAVVF